MRSFSVRQQRKGPEGGNLLGPQKHWLECFLEISIGEITSSVFPCKAFDAIFLEGIRMKHICKKDHRYDPRFTSLPENQGNTGRHKCPGCAFELAMELKAKGIPMCNDDSILADLPESQAGTVRHKDAFEAYKMAYQA